MSPLAIATVAAELCPSDVRRTFAGLPFDFHLTSVGFPFDFRLTFVKFSSDFHPTSSWRLSDFHLTSVGRPFCVLCPVLFHPTTLSSCALLSYRLHVLRLVVMRSSILPLWHPTHYYLALCRPVALMSCALLSHVLSSCTLMSCILLSCHIDVLRPIVLSSYLFIWHLFDFHLTFISFSSNLHWTFIWPLYDVCLSWVIPNDALYFSNCTLI
jgi:hypothetical protein